MMRLTFAFLALAIGWANGAKYGAPDFVINAAHSVFAVAGNAVSGKQDSPSPGASDTDIDTPEAPPAPAAALATPYSSGECGGASYYADKFVGKQTASGEIYRHSKFTAAHRTHPFGTKLRVTRRDDGRSVDVTVNDRGPFTKGRVIDVSRAAAEKIGLVVDGVADVCIEVR